LKWFRKAADQGSVVAQNNLGEMYLNGHGMRQDYAEALKWFRKAADRGLAVAQNNLGLMYARGQGVPQDYVQAHMWFNVAASQGGPVSRRSVRAREAIASLMTPAQIAEAQKLAREWKPKPER
jgi:TPR repeat protein